MITKFRSDVVTQDKSTLATLAIKYFYHSGFLSNLHLPWKQGLPWIHCI